jgi:integrative and conjugative element protein (TIGR02256 family)
MGVMADVVGRLILAKKAHDAAVEECLHYPDTETGGILVGRKVGEDFVVPFVVAGGPKARRSTGGFAPDSGWQQKFLNFLFARFGVDYLGDFHRHPGTMDLPSQHDLETAHEIVTDPSWAKPEALFPIAVIEKEEVRIRAFLITREKPEFVEVPLEVVPDTDWRMRWVLLGKDLAEKGEPCIMHA